MDSSTSKIIKIVILGDARTGKTNLLQQYCSGAFPPFGSYVPTVFDQITATVTIKNIEHKISIWDTGGNKAYDHLRHMCYPECDVFLLCFSLVNEATFWNVKDKWIPEIRSYASDTPIVIVGTFFDMRQALLYHPELDKEMEEKKKKNHELNIRKLCHYLHTLEESTLKNIPKNIQEQFETIFKVKIDQPAIHPSKQKFSLAYFKKKLGVNKRGDTELSKTKTHTKKGKQGDFKEKDIQDSDMLLPKEMWLKILSFLPAIQLCRFTCVSSFWYCVCNDRKLWQQQVIHLLGNIEQAEKDYPILLSRVKVDWKQVYLEALVEKESYRPIIYNEGVEMAKEVGAVKYLENYLDTDAIPILKPTMVLDEAIRTALGPKKKKK